MRVFVSINQKAFHHRCDDISDSIYKPRHCRVPMPVVCMCVCVCGSIQRRRGDGITGITVLSWWCCIVFDYWQMLNLHIPMIAHTLMLIVRTFAQCHTECRSIRHNNNYCTTSWYRHGEVVWQSQLMVWYPNTRRLPGQTP